MQIDACIRELSKDVNKAFLHLKNELQGYLKKELYSCHVNIWLQSLIQTIHTGLFPALNYTPDSSCVFTDYSGAWEPWHKNRPLKVAGRRWYICWLPDSGKEIHQILHSVIISLIISLITLLSSVSCAGVNEFIFPPCVGCSVALVQDVVLCGVEVNHQNSLELNLFYEWGPVAFSVSSHQCRWCI